MKVPDHLSCLLRNLYAGQEAKELDMGQMTSSKLGKESVKAVYCHPTYVLYAEYIMRNAGLDESQATIKIARKNINRLRYADDTTLMAESEEELISFLMRVKEESEKAGMKLSFQKTKILESGPITSWQTEEKKVKAVTDFIFLGSKIFANGDYNHEIKRCLFLGRKAMTKIDGVLKSRDITL